MKSSTEIVSIIQQWHIALNTGNTQQLSSLVSEDLQIGGPKGVVTGVNQLLEWVERAKVHLIPKRYFAHLNTVVAEELGQWHSPETGQIISSQLIASVFAVKDEKIISIVRYDGIKEAFKVTGLGETEEVLIG
jgi:hypothetical protein